MNIRDQIVEMLDRKTAVRGADLVRRLGISRQALNVHLKGLIGSGRVVKEGVTRGAKYRLSSRRSSRASVLQFRKRFTLKRLQEDRVFDKIALFMHVESRTSKNVAEILRYAFTEILNNAIDHSESETCRVECAMDSYRCTFRIRDCGIGIFHSIASKFRLPDERDAVGELLKGKTTTMREKHTGEGIFFASKAADVMSFRSHGIQLVFDNLRKDTFVEERRFVRGTDVVFAVSLRSRRQLSDVFAEFAPERHGYRFERTRVLVRLFQKDYVSRSEARRLLAGLDKFKEIELDFSDVKSLGQGFADEVFRVFGRAHPEVAIRTSNLRPTLEPVIRHAIDNQG